METKEIKINVPEGYEIDRENSTFECIKFKKKKLTYEDVCDALFTQKTVYYTSSSGEIEVLSEMPRYNAFDCNNATSKSQLKQLLAINKLMNVAAYLNKIPLDWESSSQDKWYIYYNHTQHKIGYTYRTWCQTTGVYFDSYRRARKAVDILGEDTVKHALGIFD